jgi:hypothetical protein
MGSIKKKLTKTLKKVTPKEIAPILPIAAMFIPGMQGLSPMLKFALPQLLTAAGSARTTGKISLGNQALAAAGSLAGIHAGNQALANQAAAANAGTPGLQGYKAASQIAKNQGIMNQALSNAAAGIAKTPIIGKPFTGLGEGMLSATSLLPGGRPPTNIGLSTLGPISMGTTMMAMDQANAPVEKGTLDDGGMTQAAYDSFLQQGKNLYTDDELNAYFAPLGAAMGGKYNMLPNPFPQFAAVQRPMFPGLNYSGLNLVDRIPIKKGGRVALKGGGMDAGASSSSGDQGAGAGVSGGVAGNMGGSQTGDNSGNKGDPSTDTTDTDTNTNTNTNNDPNANKMTPAEEVLAKNQVDPFSPFGTLGYNPYGEDDDDGLGINEFSVGPGTLSITPEFSGFTPVGISAGYTVGFNKGGEVKPKKRKDALAEIEEQKRIQRDALFPDGSPGANEEVMFDEMRRKELNPTGRAMGGRIGLANGGDLKYAVESFIRDFPEFEDLDLKDLYKEMEKRGYLGDRDEMNQGGIMLAMSDPDPMAERFDMMENLALDIFKRPLRSLSDAEVLQLEEIIDDMMPMAEGGSVPQTKNIPAGMQIDGRGGGFIPMGAKEKKDDVPAMLAKNEFVMTSDAVKAAGGGDVNKGAQRMYDLMNTLEAKV